MNARAKNTIRALWTLAVAAPLLALATPTARGGGWTIETVDSADRVGSGTSLKLDGDGNPHISYHDWTNQSLKHAWHDGVAWNLETVHDLAGVILGRYTSLVFDGSGTPHIAYFDSTNYDLWHAWKAGGVWEREIVASAGLVGYWCSIAYDLPSDSLHISYYDYDPNDRDLMHAYKTSGGGAGGWLTEVVDVPGDVGLYTSITVGSDSHVHISYYDKTNTDLKHAEKVGGAWTVEIVDLVGADAELLGKNSSIAVDLANEPHISYYDETRANRNLKHAWRAAGVWSTENIDTPGTVGVDSSITFDTTGKPHISYFDSTNGDLKHAWLDPLIGVWSTEVVDAPPGKRVGGSSSIQLGPGGLLCIGYYNESNIDLKFARQF